MVSGGGERRWRAAGAAGVSERALAVTFAVRALLHLRCSGSGECENDGGGIAAAAV